MFDKGSVKPFTISIDQSPLLVLDHRFMVIPERPYNHVMPVPQGIEKCFFRAIFVNKLKKIYWQ